MCRRRLACAKEGPRLDCRQVQPRGFGQHKVKQCVIPTATCTNNKLRKTVMQASSPLHGQGLHRPGSAWASTTSVPWRARSPGPAARPRCSSPARSWRRAAACPPAPAARARAECGPAPRRPGGASGRMRRARPLIARACAGSACGRQGGPTRAPRSPVRRARTGCRARLGRAGPQPIAAGAARLAARAGRARRSVGITTNPTCRMGQGRRHAARGPAGARGGRPRTCVRLCCAARAASCASASASAVGTCWRTSAAPRACSAAAHSLPSHARTTPWPWPAPARPRVEPGALLERQEPPSARPVSATERAGRTLHATQQGATRDTAVRCVKDAVQRRAALAPRPAGCRSPPGVAGRCWAPG